MIDEINTRTIGEIVRDNLARQAKLMTDDLHVYRGVGCMFSEHNIVKHPKRRVRQTAC